MAASGARSKDKEVQEAIILHCACPKVIEAFTIKYNIDLKTLLQQGISEPIFYGDLVHKFKRIVCKSNFSDQFNKIIKRCTNGYYLDIMRQSACLVVNPVTVYNYGFLFNCTTMGKASDSTSALM